MFLSPIIVKVALSSFIYGVLYTLVQKYFLKIKDIDIISKTVSNVFTFYILMMIFEIIKSRFTS